MKETTATVKQPLALIVQGREPAEIAAYACGACGIVARTEDDARRCCDRRCGCGAPLARGYSECEPCMKRHRDERAAERVQKDEAALAAAPRVPYAAYEGKYLYSERLDVGGDGAGYFPDVEELLERCADEVNEPPTLVWACSPVKMSFDADDLISSACEEMYEDAAGDVGQGACRELQEFLDAWCEKHSPTSYTPNPKLAVDISAEVAAWKAEQEAEEPAA